MYIKGKWNHGRYRILSLIGSGNFGRVYKVEDNRGQIKAIKISQDTLSITNEYNSMLNFKDMFFIPKIYDFDDLEYKGEIYHFIIMDYVDGRNLKQIIDHKSLSPKTVFKIGEILLNILERIDRLGFKYTDIKLENIMIDKNSNLFFIDFGSLVKKDKPTKEYTPTYNINSWNVKFNHTYEGQILFSVTMIMVSLLGKKEYNPMLFNIDRVIDVVESFPLRKKEKDFLINGLSGKYKDFNEYKTALPFVINNRCYSRLDKIDYLLIISIVSFVFVAILGLKVI